MEMEFQLPSSLDFDFNNGRSSRFLSTPPSPKRFGEFFSVPASPARDSEVYSGFDDDLPFTIYERGEASTSSSPFNWDGNGSRWPVESPQRLVDSAPGISGQYASDPKATQGRLNDGRALKLPHYEHGVKESEALKSLLLSPQTRSSKNSKHKKNFWRAFSPKRKKENTHSEAREKSTEQVRGRERVSTLSTSRAGRRGARSLSPDRVSEYPWEEEKEIPNMNICTAVIKPASSNALSLLKGSRKWKLRDFLLFRSASEGRASEKDPFKKYADLYRKQQTSKSTSLKSADGTSITPAQKKGPVSAHELHYTVNKAISQDMRKKSFLPYKQGLLGRLAFSPTAHALAYGF